MMTTSISNFFELHVNLCMHMDCLEKYLKTIGTRYGRRYFIVTLDGNCWMIDPKTFDESFDEKKCSADRKIKILKDIPENTVKIKIPDGVMSIGLDAFYDCSMLTSMTIPNSVTSIGGSAFSGCDGLTSVTIPDSVTRIGGGAFGSCSGLMSVTIPDSVTRIGIGAFYECTSLKSLVFKRKTLDEVKKMNYYPWGIEDESIIRVR